MDVQNLVEEFLEVKAVHGAAPRTLNDYHEKLSSFCRQEQLPKNQTESDIQKAVNHFLARVSHQSPSTYNLYLEYLRVFFHWAVDEGFFQTDPTRSFKKRKNEASPRAVSLDEIKKLLAVIDTSVYTGLRDYALILFQLDTGIRPKEALSLRPIDIDLPRQEAQISPLVAKTRTARLVVFSAPTKQALRKLLAVRPADWKPTVPVFADRDGLPFLRSSWSHQLQKYCAKAGVKITPYQLRHTFAITYLRQGGNVFALQRQLGHSDLNMTKHYLWLAETDLHEQHSIASPVTAIYPERHRVGKIKSSRKGR